MAKKDKFAAVFTGIILFIIAALFSISILVSALEFGAEDSFLYLFGNLLTSVYGFCSALIPVFLFVAGAFCFAENWSVKKACILLVSLIPFFTLVFSEHIIRTISESDSSPAAAMKIFTVASIAVLLVITEFLLAVVLAEHFHEKLAKLKLPDPLKKGGKTDDGVEIVFEDDDADSVKADVPVYADSDNADEDKTQSDDSDSADKNSGKVKGADGWELTSVLEKNRREIEKNTAEAEEKRASSKYDSLWDLDENGEIKGLNFDREDTQSDALSSDSDADSETDAEADPSEEKEEEREEIVFEDFGDTDFSEIPDEEENDGSDENYSEDEIAAENQGSTLISEENEADVESDDKDDGEKTKEKSAPFMNIDTSDIKEVDLINLEEENADEDVITRFEKENMSGIDGVDISTEFEDEDNGSKEYSSEIPFDDFDEDDPDSAKRPETDIDRLLDDFETIEDDSEKKNYDVSKSEDSAVEELEAIETPSEKAEKIVPSVFDQLGDVFSKMDEDAEAAVSKTSALDPLAASLVQDDDANGTAKEKKPAPLVKKRRPPYKISTDLLTEYKENPYWEIDAETESASASLMATLKEFNIEANVTAIRKGPVVTMFEMLPAPGVKLSKIQALQDNIALRLAAKSVRIVAPIPGKRAVGIEVPNKSRAIVSFRECIEQNRPEWKKMQVPVVLGKDIEGETQIMDLVKTPHLLIAGSTGAGKSVCVNSMILSILYKRSPNEVKMILIDPKIVELSLYNGIGHLLTPVITEPKMAMQALQYCLCEMERRYAVLKSLGCRDILSYNQKIVEQHIATEKLPYIIVVVDEFADLMATTGKQLEAAIARLAAKARAIGIHLVLATQRPSVDVITGLIKANIPSRIAFMVSSKMDSRIIIDQMGAEKLLGKGDMLYASSTDPFPVRIQGALVSDQEVENVVNEVKNLWGEPEYIDDEIFVDDDEDGDGQMSLFSGDGDDPLYEKALDIVVQAGKASASYIQRKLSIGYNRAARLVEIMEERGIVGPANGSKPREIIHIP